MRAGRADTPADRTWQDAAKIVLLCEDPALTGAGIAAEVGCNPAKVSKRRKRFAKQGGRFRQITTDDEDCIVETAKTRTEKLGRSFTRCRSTNSLPTSPTTTTGS